MVTGGRRLRAAQEGRDDWGGQSGVAGEKRSRGFSQEATEGRRGNTRCSFPAEPVAVLTAGDGERRGRPPTGVVWVT